MKRSAKVLAFFMLALLLLATTGCNKLRARDQLNKGVQAYKNNKFEDAIEKFKNAVALDPSLSVAQLYLATAYANQCTPGVDTPENNRTCDQAIQAFKDVAAKDPNNLTAVKGIASLYFQMKKFDEAKQYNRKAIEIDPKDAEAYYSIGVIDWTQTYTPRMEARNKLGLKPDEPLKDKKVCEEVKDKNSQLVDEGMKALDKALEIRPDYDDAMAYYNLLWREKADIECGDAAAREADLKQADSWVDKTLAVKKEKAEKAAQQTGGITLDQNAK
ncbi:MAG TPA: tetratricopeptide repeat protein [Terriglobales bacterium]|nr:tetratricopeptide repeat protein [Terriglobales bacterium]